VIWRRKISSPTPLLITLAGADLYAASQSYNQMYRTDAHTGVLEKTFLLPPTPMCRLAATQSRVLTTLKDNFLLCVDRDLKSVRWRQTLPAEVSTKQPFIGEIPSNGDGSALRVPPGGRYSKVIVQPAWATRVRC
jgi:hypothetical protein